MPPRPKSIVKGRWRAIALSALLHAAIVCAAVYSWFSWKHRPPEEATLAIEATVVDESELKGAPPTPKPDPAPPEPMPAPEPEATPAPAEEQGPPKPDPAELERKQEEDRLAAEKAEQEKQEKIEQAKKTEDRQAQQLREREDAERREAEKQAAAKSAAAKAAADKAASDKKAAEKKRADDAAATKKAADEKARLAREAELRRNLEAEERVNALRNSDAMARWQAAITARIERAWIKPPSAQPGISCIVSVTQVPGGEVTAVHVDSCSGGDAALRESVEAAVYRASPLPPPPDPALFERNLILTFEPK
jgi:colicin import membrane protein